MRKAFFILSSFFSLCYVEAKIEKVSVDLIDPIYKGGILKTTKGGVIKGDDFRLQADHISYTYTTKEGRLLHNIEASGNILLQYQKRIFVGNTLKFNLDTGYGIIECATTQSCPWYITSEKITLKPDKTIEADNTSISICEKDESSWDLKAKQVQIDDYKLSANGVRFNLFKFLSVPFFPIKASLRKKNPHPPFKYSVKFDRGRPKASVRLQAYSYYDFYIYLRGDYRLPSDFWKNNQWQKGFGGAIETDYLSKDRRKKLLTRSYVANDVLIDDPKQKTRYRLQGEGCYKSEDKSIVSGWTWDKYSDRKMPQDFRSSDFEVDSRLRSEFYLSAQKERGTLYFYLHPRLNSFETINQDLPSVSIRTHPLEAAGFVYDSWSKTSYLDFEYSDEIDHLLSDFDSGRFQTYHNLYRPINLGAFTITPNVGASGIFYSDSPTDQAKGLGVFFTGVYAKANFYKCFSTTKHIFEPYLHYKYIDASSSVDSHYIFSTQDGLTDLSEFTVGIKNLFSEKQTCSTWVIDLYSHLFFDQSTIDRLPRVYLDLSYNLPNIELLVDSAWSVEHNTLHYSNFLTRYTHSEGLALSLELRYRSKYAWRKSNHDNFFLDVTRDENELIISPLSDRRFTILSHVFYKLNHYFSLQLQSHHGFLREDQTPYNEFKLDLITSISTHWKMTLSFQHQEGGNQWGMTFKLVK